MSTTEAIPKGTWFSLWPVVLVLAILGVAIWGDKGILCALRANQQKDDLLRQIQVLESANQELRKEIEALKSNPRYLEAIARKELGMVRQDELVYQFRSQGKPASQPAPTGN